MKKCITCKIDFEEKHNKAIFCSNKCRQKNHRSKIKILIDSINVKKIIKTPEIKIKKTNDEYDFSQVLFFKIEDFTKYPKSDKPLEYLQAKEWNSLKLKSDEEIRKKWFKYKTINKK